MAGWLERGGMDGFWGKKICTGKGSSLYTVILKGMGGAFYTLECK